jgi:hypothetical protein
LLDDATPFYGEDEDLAEEYTQKPTGKSSGTTEIFSDEEERATFVVHHIVRVCILALGLALYLSQPY